MLIRLLVTAQLLAVAPLANALPAESGDATPCAGMMDMASLTDDTNNCPCCPDGADSMRDCLVSCTLAATALPVIPHLSRAPADPLRVRATLAAPFRSVSDPPLKPPPIR